MIHTGVIPNQMIPPISVLANIYINKVSPTHPLSLEISRKHLDCRRRRIVKCVISDLKFVFVTLSCFYNFLFSQAIYHGTTIVVLRTKDSIVVGADSKLSSMQPSTFGNAAPFPIGTIEKIRIAGNMAYAIGGFYAWGDTDLFTGKRINTFDAFAVAQVACSGEDNIFQKSARFCLTVKPAAEAAWKNVLEENPMADLSKLNLIFIACGIYQDIPYVVSERCNPKSLLPMAEPFTPIFPSIVPHSPTTYLPEALMTEDTIPSNASQIDSRFLFGTGGADNLGSVPWLNNISFANSIEAVRKIVGLAIANDSTGSGYPIKILCITRKGFDWIP